MNHDDRNEDAVRFEFETFVQSDYRGHENADMPALRGYIVYNGDRKDFGFSSFGNSDSYTLAYDVLHRIRKDHDAFMKDIVANGGFHINGRWHSVNGNGELQ